jgi:hypothetical protein
MEQGYELLGDYLTSDLYGVDSPYIELRQIVDAALTQGIEDTISTDGFAVDVRRDNTTVRLHSRPNRSVTLTTEAFSAALNAYAAYYREVSP